MCELPASLPIANSARLASASSRSKASTSISQNSRLTLPSSSHSSGGNSSSPIWIDFSSPPWPARSCLVIAGLTP
jgi:hypothetical protein